MIAMLALLLQEEWVPLKEKAAWTYDWKSKVSGMESSGTMTATVTGKDGDDWVLEWKETRRNKTKTRTEIRVRSTADAVVITKTSEEQTMLAPADFSTKTKSTVKIFKGKREIVAESTAGDEEEVETPAGKFKARKVSSLVKAPGTTVTSTVWYAKGTGAVKILHLVEVGGTKVEEELLLKKRE